MFPGYAVGGLKRVHSRVVVEVIAGKPFVAFLVCRATSVAMDHGGFLLHLVGVGVKRIGKPRPSPSNKNYLINQKDYSKEGDQNLNF